MAGFRTGDAYSFLTSEALKAFDREDNIPPCSLLSASPAPISHEMSNGASVDGSTHYRDIPSGQKPAWNLARMLFTYAEMKL